MRVWQVLLLAIALAGGVTASAGCAANRRGEITRPVEPRESARTREVRPLSEEKAWTDRAGEILVVILGVALAVGGVVAGLAVGGAI